VNEPVAVASGQRESIAVNVIVYVPMSASLIVDHPTTLPNPLLLDTPVIQEFVGEIEFE
jgi:hypothetical protein